MTTTTLDDLARESSDALEARYRSATAPHALRGLDGEPVGRMLAVRWADRAPVLGALAAMARSASFVWRGKTFRSRDDASGSGVNRVLVRRVLGLQELFPFETRIGASVLDRRPAVVLDYDLSANPGYIRHIHDEVREIAPGLWLGPAAWRTEQRGHVVLLWFALDTR